MNFFSKKTLFRLILCLSVLPHLLFSQKDSLLKVEALKKLSLEELMNIEVTSVSKHAERLNEVASAIQVITQDDIRRSGVKTLPEALKLASNLQVAQVNASQWAISARGFNNVLANKLLVLIDGRTVYTPLYAGVFWDVQNLLLEDIERIEVISGPGGTLWGSNAVNGVINIITKNSGKTQGFFAEGAIGTELPGLGSLRYGGNITDDISYRIYGTGFQMGNTVLLNDSSAKDDWWMSQGGLRLDWDATLDDQVTLQFNMYDGRPDPDGDMPVIARGDNILGKWNHTISEKSDFQLQLYYDHTWRDFGNKFTENLKTYDLDWQNRYKLGQRNVVTYGLGTRLMDHKVENLELFAFLPARKILHLHSLFIQDEVSIVKERLRLIIGTKLEHNNYTGFEYQPSGRMVWTPSENHTVWSAVSRAVRLPARIDREFVLSAAPDFPIISGSNLIAEELLAYELGWRLQPAKKLSLSLATFYNVYDNIRSAEPGPTPFNLPITFANGVYGETYGAELAATTQLTDWWNLRGGYTFLRKNLWIKPESKDLNEATAESNDPEHQFLVQTTIDLPAGVEVGAVMRYVDKLPAPHVPGYFGLDVRLGWKLNKFLELNVVGQNLLDNQHVEFIPSNTTHKIERSIYGKLICRL